jgi:hypothetical protein
MIFWSRLFPAKPTDPRAPREPGPQDPPPAFAQGDRVRLKSRPERVRAVLEVEWHRHRHKYCYRVETSTSDAGLHDPSYWFEEDLVRAG